MTDPDSKLPKGHVKSAHTGKILQPSIPMSIWLKTNEGYIYGSDLKNVPQHQLALQYLEEKKIPSRKCIQTFT